MPRKTKIRIDALSLDNKLNGPDAKISCSLQERAKIIQFNEAARLLSGTRLSGPPIARLVDSGKIGAEELQAAQEIERAFMALAGGLFMKPQSMERVDGGRGQVNWPHRLAQTVRQYQEWANFWSARRKQNLDHTLEIVIAAVIDERHIRPISEDLGFGEAKITKAIVRGLRDYAARAGWISGSIADVWKSDALQTFAAPVHK